MPRTSPREEQHLELPSKTTQKLEESGESSVDLSLEDLHPSDISE
jgi:hypothetical protein